MAEETKHVETVETTIDYKAELEKMQSDYIKLKSNFDKTSSEVADYKRKEKERMTDEQKRQAEFEEREKKYAELEKQIALRDYADELSDISDNKIKTNIVQAFADGDIKGALKQFKEWRASYRSELEKEIKAELMRQNGTPTPQQSSATKTKEQIMAIKDPVERQREIANNIKLFQ